MSQLRSMSTQDRQNQSNECLPIQEVLKFLNSSFHQVKPQNNLNSNKHLRGKLLLQLLSSQANKNQLQEQTQMLETPMLEIHHFQLSHHNNSNSQLLLLLSQILKLSQLIKPKCSSKYNNPSKSPTRPKPLKSSNSRL